MSSSTLVYTSERPRRPLTYQQEVWRELHEIVSTTQGWPYTVPTAWEQDLKTSVLDLLPTEGTDEEFRDRVIDLIEKFLNKWDVNFPEVEEILSTLLADRYDQKECGNERNPKPAWYEGIYDEDVDDDY